MTENCVICGCEPIVKCSYLSGRARCPVCINTVRVNPFGWENFRANSSLKRVELEHLWDVQQDFLRKLMVANQHESEREDR